MNLNKKIPNLAGLEPTIFWFEVRRVIHYATGPRYLHFKLNLISSYLAHRWHRRIPEREQNLQNNRSMLCWPDQEWRLQNKCARYWKRNSGSSVRGRSGCHGPRWHWMGPIGVCSRRPQARLETPLHERRQIYAWGSKKVVKAKAAEALYAQVIQKDWSNSTQ